MRKTDLWKMRLASILAGLVMLAGVAPLCSAAEREYECLLLRTENIALPQNAEGGDAAGWSVSPYPAGAYYGLLSDESGKYLGVINTNAGQAGYNRNFYASASIYVQGDEAAEDKCKDYYVWVAGRKDAARACHIAFDESNSFTSLSPIPSGHSTMAWGTAKETSFRLSEGIHTLKIKVGDANSANMQAVIITDDAEFSPIGKSYTELAQQAIVDITPPVIEDENAFSYLYSSDGDATFIFPNVSDESGVRYVCKIGDRTEVSADENLPVHLEGVQPLEELVVEWYATDRINTVKRSWKVVASPVAAEGFALKGADGSETLHDLLTLGAGDKITLETSLTNRTAEEKNLSLILILYTKNYERILAEKEVSISLSGGEADRPAAAELTLPEEFDAGAAVLSALLWDSEGQEPYIAGIELRGSTS